VNPVANHDVHERCVWLDAQSMSDREKNDGAAQCLRELAAMAIVKLGHGQESSFGPTNLSRTHDLQNRDARGSFQ